MKKRQNTIVENLQIEKITPEGKGLSRKDGFVVFVENALPGDIADVEIHTKKKDYAIGKINKLLVGSNDRQASFCQHFGICGGCKWQFAKYGSQLQYKYGIVKEAFERIGKFPFPEILPIIGCDEPVYYRNKMEYTFTDRRWLTIEEIQSGQEYERRALGFHVPGGFAHVTHIEKCWLQDEKADQIRNGIYTFCLENEYEFVNLKAHEGLMKSMFIRNTLQNEWMVIVVFGRNDEEKIAALMAYVQQAFSFITSLNYVVNPKKNDTIFDLDVVNVHGKDHIIEQLGEIKYKISPKSFFQTNSRQAEILYTRSVELAGIKSGDIVYDLYTGTGSIALFVAGKCKKVIGLEQIPEAIEDARANAMINHIENAVFYTGNVEDMFDEQFVADNGDPDIVITDPPRSGMHSRVVETFLKALPKKIVYISCNPATQARDIGLLSEKYEVLSVQPVDMFPQTYHVENIAVLQLIQ